NIKTGKLDANQADENGKYPFFTCSKEISKINSYSYDCECVLVAGNGDLNVKYHNGKFEAYQRTYILTSTDVNTLSNKYIYWFMNRYIVQLRNQSIGGVIKYIKLGDLTNISLNLPTLDVQKRIVGIFESIERLISKKVFILKGLDDLIKSRFVEMFGDPNMVALNKSVKFSSVAKIITGNTPSRKLPEYYGDYIEWIKSDNIISTNLYISQAKEFLSEQGAAKGRVAPKDSLLMTCIAGSIRSIGNVGICDRSVAFNQQINAIVLKNNINPLYIYWLLKLFKPSIIANVEMSLKGIISKSQLENMLIPIIASQEEQELFIKFALQINKLKSDVQKSIDETQLLMDSLMQEYFG
ncbi:restriction endonuclease subunit S, partial [Veillonella tobetsuensis]|uniref:restriction endonuclease subunit S n=1 Tax=Veillonella tobetsuensis TaxID=1110546 RepID=UPI0010F4B094